MPDPEDTADAATPDHTGDARRWLPPMTAGLLASLGLAGVLLALAGFGVWAAFATFRAGQAVRHGTEHAEAFEDARFAVGAEESLERKYRLSPEPEIKAAHRAAADDLVAALRRAIELDDASERPLAEGVLATHALYLDAIDRLFAATDAGDTGLADAIDGAEVDPTFDAIEQRVNEAATQHRAEARRQLAALANIQHAVLFATPLALGFGMVLLLVFWSIIRSYRRRVEETLRREAESIRLSERRLSALVQHASDVTLIADAEWRIRYESPSVAAAWGYAPGELIGGPVTALIHPEEHAVLGHARGDAGGPPETTIRTDVRVLTADGEWRNVELTLANLLAEPAIEGFVVTAHDVTERRAFEQQLADQAFHDALTGLPNRALLYDRLGHAIARADRWGGSIALLFLDLDNFKLINDSLGHEAGDRLLVAVAERLRLCTRAENTVARLGGDEFTVVLEQVSGREDAVAVADRIADQFQKPFLLSGQEIFITASVGIATGGPANRQPESLLRDADLAMYRAKARGKAQYAVFNAAMHEEAVSRLELEKDLRRAIDGGQELRLHYQPVVLLDSGRVVEVEALVRWQHPRRGLVLPEAFIPVAEETGLIVPLGRWVLREACHQVKVWHDEFPSDPPLTLSVNLSPREFGQPFLLETICETLDETGFPPTSLRLEITEGLLMRDPAAAVGILHQLKGRGIQLAVDDFGTGYSSLAYLKQLPLDVLKIDRSFVEGIGRDLESTAIVQAIVSLAQTLNLAVTGEGIETPEQAAQLRSFACERGQGHHFACPDEPRRIEALLRLAVEEEAEEVA